MNDYTKYKEYLNDYNKQFKERNMFKKIGDLVDWFSEEPGRLFVCFFGPLLFLIFLVLLKAVIYIWFGW